MSEVNDYAEPDYHSPALEWIVNVGLIVICFGICLIIRRMPDHLLTDLIR